MKHIRRVLLLLMTALLAVTLVPAAAQDEAAGPLDDLSQLEGIESAVNRSYSVDFAALMSITPEDPDADPFAGLEGAWLVFMQVIRFDNDDNAEAAYNLVKDEGGESFAASVEGDQTEFSEGDID